MLCPDVTYRVDVAQFFLLSSDMPCTTSQKASQLWVFCLFLLKFISYMQVSYLFLLFISL